MAIVLPDDPEDDEAAKAMFDWLVKTQRIAKVGELDGVGWLLVYRQGMGHAHIGASEGFLATPPQGQL